MNPNPLRFVVSSILGGVAGIGLLLASLGALFRLMGNTDTDLPFIFGAFAYAALSAAIIFGLVTNRGGQPLLAVAMVVTLAPIVALYITWML